MTIPARKIATSKEIRGIIGETDNELIAAVMDTQARPSDIAEAFAWLCADDHLGGDLERPMSDVVRRVYEILQEDRDSLSREERS